MAMPSGMPHGMEDVARKSERAASGKPPAGKRPAVYKRKSAPSALADKLAAMKGSKAPPAPAAKPSAKAATKPAVTLESLAARLDALEARCDAYDAEDMEGEDDE